LRRRPTKISWLQQAGLLHKTLYKRYTLDFFKDDGHMDNKVSLTVQIGKGKKRGTTTRWLHS